VKEEKRVAAALAKHSVRVACGASIAALVLLTIVAAAHGIVAAAGLACLLVGAVLATQR